MIKEGLKKACEIENFTVVQKNNKKAVEIKLGLKNTGTVHLRPVTTIVIMNESKEVVDKVNLGKSLPLFSEFTEGLSASTQLTYPGIYTAVATVDIGDGELVQKQIEFEVK